MSEQTDGVYTPGTYAKGDDVRTARNSRQAVALVFEGYVRQADPEPEDEQAPEAQPKAEEAVRDDVAPKSSKSKSSE